VQESEVKGPQASNSSSAFSAPTTNHSLLIRALLAIVLTIGFYALALSIAGALLYSVYFEWEYIGAVPVQLALF